MEPLILIIVSKLFLFLHYGSKLKMKHFSSILIVLGYAMLFVNYTQQYLKKTQNKKNKEQSLGQSLEYDKEYDKEHLLEHSSEMKEVLGYTMLFIYYSISVIFYSDKIHMYDYAALLGFAWGILRRLGNFEYKLFEIIPLITFYSLYSYTHIEETKYLSGIGGMLSSIFYILQLIK
jgi:hypothetical protein